MQASQRTLLVTGAAGFIGSALVRNLIDATDHRVVSFDALTYAGDRSNLAHVDGHARHTFVHADVTDAAALDLRWYLEHLDWCNARLGTDDALERRGTAVPLAPLGATR